MRGYPFLKFLCGVNMGSHPRGLTGNQEHSKDKNPEIKRVSLGGIRENKGKYSLVYGRDAFLLVFRLCSTRERFLTSRERGKSDVACQQRSKSSHPAGSWGNKHRETGIYVWEATGGRVHAKKIEKRQIKGEEWTLMSNCGS